MYCVSLSVVILLFLMHHWKHLQAVQCDLNALLVPQHYTIDRKRSPSMEMRSLPIVQEGSFCIFKKHKQANVKPASSSAVIFILNFIQSPHWDIHFQVSVSRLLSLPHSSSLPCFVPNYWCQSQPRTTRTQEEGCHLQKESQMAAGILCLLPFSHLLLFWFRLMSSHSDSTHSKCKSTHLVISVKMGSHSRLYVCAACDGLRSAACIKRLLTCNLLKQCMITSFAEHGDLAQSARVINRARGCPRSDSCSSEDALLLCDSDTAPSLLWITALKAQRTEQYKMCSLSN